MPGSSLTVDVATRPQHVLVTVAGDLDIDTRTDVTQLIDELPLEGRTLTLDMSGVTFMDSSGLSLLLDLRRRVEDEGAGLELAAPSFHTLRVLDLTGTRRLFTIRP
ncbi:STAS domain-containing protein [Streptomyces sp. NPDC089919]|uniref:STAS domain-containing protein n=1 Tax=Streptomyces sp. NPDC089919 TaxID=3155188 RepID=UPI0034272E3B